MRAGTAEVLLDLREIAVRFGAVVGLGGVSFCVHQGEILGLIGPNGSGKTTLFNCISGFYRPQHGEVRLRGRRVTGLPRHRIASLGIGRTFQNLALFSSMTVRENVLVGAHPLGRSGFLDHAFTTPRARREAAVAEARLAAVLDLLDLAAHAHRPVSALPFGTAKRVEIARALIAEPALLLLDEPACGLNHSEVEDLFVLLRRLHARAALTIVLVEHHMGLVMRLCERVVVLAAGSKIADGPPEAVQKNPDVVRAYLGVAAEHVRAA